MFQKILSGQATVFPKCVPIVCIGLGVNPWNEPCEKINQYLTGFFQSLTNIFKI